MRVTSRLAMQTRCIAAALLLILSLTSGDGVAQTYPASPVRLVVGFPPGGPTDIVARLMSQWLTERLGVPLVIENRPGAGSNIATQAVVNAPPDGGMLIMLSHANAINATLFTKMPFDILTDIVPVAGLIQVPNVVEVHPSLPVNSVADLIAYAKANPGKLNYASAGNGTSAHMAAELFKAMTGVNLVHIPYRGSGPAVTDMISGEVKLMFDSMPSSLEHIRAGRLRALAVTSTTRSPALPNVPTVADTVAGYETTGWFGIGAPKGTPASIVERLNREINAGLADASIQARLAAIGASPHVVTPAEYAAFVAAETSKWARAVKFSGAKVD